MTDNLEVEASSKSNKCLVSGDIGSKWLVVCLELSVSPVDSSSAALRRLAMLPERFVKLLAILATLSFRMMELADALVRISLRTRPDIPGYGSISRVQTSARIASKRTRSVRAGARMGTRLVVRSDCDLLMDADDIGCEASLAEFVFLIMT